MSQFIISRAPRVDSVEFITLYSKNVKICEVYGITLLLFMSPYNKTINSCHSLKNRACNCRLTISKFTEISLKVCGCVFQKLKSVIPISQSTQEIRWNLRTCSTTRNLEKISVYLLYSDIQFQSIHLFDTNFSQNKKYQETRVMRNIYSKGSSYIYTWTHLIDNDWPIKYSFLN